MYYLNTGELRFKMANVIRFLCKYIYNNDEGSVNYKVICAKHIDKLWKNLVIIFPIIWLSYNGIMFGPIYAYYAQNARTTPLGVHLPFFERDSDAEYFTSMTFQSSLSVYTILANYLEQILTCAIVSTITLFPDMVQFNLSEFYEEFQKNGICLKSTARLRNALIQIWDFHEYISNVHFIYKSSINQFEKCFII